LPRLGRSAPSRLGRDSNYPVELGRPSPFPGWARTSLPGVGWHPFPPRLGRRAPPAGPGSSSLAGPPSLLQSGSPPSGWAGSPSLRLGHCLPRLGRFLLQTGFSSAQARILPPGRHFRWAAKLAGRGHSPGQNMPAGLYLGTVPAGPGRDSPGPGRITSPLAGFAPSGPGLIPSGLLSPSGINFIILCQSWDTQAQTGRSSTLICWSWDAPWLRPAYSTSPSQPYPQEEDKTDDMKIQKAAARRRRPSTPRTDSNGMTMTQCTVPRTVPC
jgi:hypothetical protein